MVQFNEWYEYMVGETKYRVRIEFDKDPLNPRHTDDNIAVLCLKHKRYELPYEMELNKIDAEQFHVFDVWGYDHGSLAMKCGRRTYPFDDPWDSGRFGWALVPKSKIADFGEALDRAIEEVATYDAYLNGRVYGYVIEKLLVGTTGGGRQITQWAYEDACWGCYSIADMDLPQEAKEALGI